MAELTARDQLMLELINRARMDPASEAARLGVDLNANLPPGTITFDPKQVLAPNPLLTGAGLVHAQFMIDSNTFTYQGVGDTNFVQQITGTGYDIGDPPAVGAAIAAITATEAEADAGIPVLYAAMYNNTFQRMSIYNDALQEFGMGSDVGLANFFGSGAISTLALSIFYASPATPQVFVTGVHYADTDANDFYSIGEGEGGRTVNLLQNEAVVATGHTGTAGGYSLATAISGRVEIQFSGGGLAATYGATFQLGATNVKIDLIDDHSISSNVSVALTAASQSLNLIGIGQISGKGNGLDNDISGNAAKNALFGLTGDDLLLGKAGNDRLFGGRGGDTLDGGARNDQLTGEAGSDILTGGSGKDSFVFTGLSDMPKLAQCDVITDFTPGTDSINLSQFGGLSFLNGTGHGEFSGLGAGSEGQVRFVTGFLEIDTDGNGNADFRVALSGSPVLGIGDVIL